MSTPNSHRSARGGLHTPSESRSTSQSSQTRNTDRPSFSVEPRSDVLRSALAARRAKDAPATPSPAQPRPIPHRTVSASVAAKSPMAASVASIDSSGDPWLDQAKSEEGMPNATTARRGRRPSESGIRLPTQREQQTENDTLKTNLFNMGMQNTLLKEQNNKLKDELDEANRRIEELEAMEQENCDLRDTNARLTISMQNMEDEMMKLDAENREILQIQSESVQNMEKQHTALEEAADVIIELEQEKTAFQEEILRLKAQVARSTSSYNGSESFHDALDGQAKEKHPSRIHSIDESRPSTSHFDSDYYSQPGSPRVKVRPSKDLATHFKEVSITSQRSTQDLKKRFSDVSMKSQLPRQTTPAPEVPKIPESYDNTYLTVQAADATRSPNRPQRERPQQPSSMRQPTTMGPSVRAPTTPTTQEGLRGLFRDPRAVESPSTPSSRYQSPTSFQARSRYAESVSPSVAPPRRNSSRYVQKTSSERLEAPSSEDVRAMPPSGYTDSTPPDPYATTEDLTLLPDSQRYWKNLEGVRSVATYGNDKPQPLTRNPSSAGSRSIGVPELFNAAEDEEQFMRRAKGFLPRRK